MIVGGGSIALSGVHHAHAVTVGAMLLLLLLLLVVIGLLLLPLPSAPLARVDELVFVVVGQRHCHSL